MDSEVNKVSSFRFRWRMTQSKFSVSVFQNDQTRVTRIEMKGDSKLSTEWDSLKPHRSFKNCLLGNFGEEKTGVAKTAVKMGRSW